MLNGLLFLLFGLLLLGIGIYAIYLFIGLFTISEKAKTFIIGMLGLIAAVLVIYLIYIAISGQAPKILPI